MGAILKISKHRAWTAAAALVVFGTSARPSRRPRPLRLSPASRAPLKRALPPSRPRSVALQDGRVLRLAGIESFALLLPQGDEADAALQRRLQALVAGRDVHVKLVAETADRHGRLPALIAVGDGPLVQEVLAREGLAVAFAAGDPIACFDNILAAEGDARTKGEGFWSLATIPVARPESLRPHTGRFAIFDGRVVSVGARRALTYLNFGLRWSEDVTVAIEARHRDRFGGDTKIADLTGRRVRIRGFVEERASPMVTVSTPMQIEVLGEARL
jgi:endonuclease YncB( thermonuclease family)